VAYVVEAPLWKSTYRLTLSDDPTAKMAALQGWAVLENLSGEDWDKVDLTIVSGNPVTFQQALYQAYYVARPEVPVEVLGRIMPRVDTGAVAQPAEVPASGKRSRILAGADASGLGPDDGAPMAEPMMEMAAPAPMPEKPQGAAIVAAAESTEATTQVVFHLAEPISVASGHSVMVPIVSRDIAVERLSLYQPGTHPTNPLASVRLKNDGDTGLPPGILTLYERAAASGLVSFVGDAQVSALPAGEERLVSFALDQKVKVLRESTGSRPIVGASIVDGVLQLRMTERAETTYTIEGAAREPRTVVVEHPRLEGYDLIVDDGVPVEKTETQYRLKVEVAAGATATLKVALQRPIEESVALIDMNDQLIEYYASATELSPPVRAAIAELRGYKATVATREAELNRLREQYQTIVKGQERIRANLQSVPRDTDLHRKYLDTMSKQEEQLTQLAAAIAQAEDALQAAHDALRTYAQGLKL
jgi:hypothetical protein